MAHKEGQEHPIKLYLVVWGWLFVLSTCSFLVDYLGCEGFLRWFLILLFMIVKAGLIVAVFMHMAWERLALDVCHSGAAGGGVAVCGHHGIRVGLHALHSGRILRNGGR
jgi:Prokaryotic Cytochrome C oxidase subunit IV